jgi:hypothetical protein
MPRPALLRRPGSCEDSVMARKMDLRRTRQTFVEVLTSGEAAWQSSQSAPAERRKTVAEDIFLRFVVGWETFVSDWFIGGVNHDSFRYKQAFEQRMNNWLQGEVQRVYGRYKVNFPRPTLLLKRYPSLSEVRALLDHSEANIEFRTLQDLASRANQELTSTYANRVSALMNAGADEVVDAALAIRNALAHRSRRAVREMNEGVAAFPSYAELRKKRMSSAGIGTYLNARTPGGEARLAVFRREFERIAMILVP